MKSKLAIGVALSVVAVFALWHFMYPAQHTRAEGGPLVDVTVPNLDAEAAIGEAIFVKNCSTCHGANAAGRDGFGPPLVHIIYEPNHHGDASFYLAVARGVRAHHWPFGNMPAIVGVSEEDTSAIITYIRTLQRANGII